MPQIWILAVAILVFWSQKWPYLEEGELVVLQYQTIWASAKLAANTSDNNYHYYDIRLLILANRKQA